MKGIRQHDKKDCGAACLATILKFYKSYVPLSEIRQKMKIGKEGTSLYMISETAKEYHLCSDSYKCSPDEFFLERKNLHFPLIAHIVLENQEGHFIVIYKMTSAKIKAFDPDYGNITLSREDFIKKWSCVFLSLMPNGDFVPVKKNRDRYHRYFHIVYKQKLLFIITLLLSLILAVISIICSLSYQIIIDKYILNTDSDFLKISFFSDTFLFIGEMCKTFGQLFLSLIVLYVLQSAIFLIQGYLIANIYEKTSEYLFLSYFKHLIRLPLSFFCDRDTGDIISRYDDIYNIQGAITSIGLNIIINICMIIAGAYVLFSINSILFFITAFTTVLYIIIAIIYKKTIRTLSLKIMESNAAVLSKLKETVDGIETVKAFSAESIFEDELDSRTKKYVKICKKNMVVSISQNTSLIIVQSISGILILWAGTYFVVNNIMTLGTLIAFQTLMAFFISPVINILSLQTDIQRAFVAAERLDDVYCTQKDTENDHKRENKEKCYDINILNFSYSYGFNEPIIKETSLNIPHRSKIALLGESGSGKSTFLKSLGLINMDYKGSIKLGKYDINNNISENKKYIVYLPQTPWIFAGSLKDNILLGHKNDIVQLDNIMKVIFPEEINVNPDFLNMRISEDGRNLSGGEKQKIAIARVLVKKPHVILLDESTCHMDSETEKRILDYMFSECNQSTIILATHKRELARRCQKVLLIKEKSIQYVECF